MQLQYSVPLAPKTSYRIGGAAHAYLQPLTAEEIMEGYTWARERNLPVFLLGRGSNILVSDSGFSGLVIDMAQFDTIRVENDTLIAGAGAQLTRTVLHAVEAGLMGLEDLAGIPGTVGGGVVMNAGAYTQTISDCIASVTALNTQTGEIVTAPIEQLSFGYRTSSFKNSDSIILEASWKPRKGQVGELRDRIAVIQQQRREKQPLSQPSCGSVFKRPPDQFAGSLIESAGLKGLSIGGAQISLKHANFFVNTGNATAADIRNLISAARRGVYDSTGILLEPEVIFVGDFPEPLWNPAS